MNTLTVADQAIALDKDGFLVDLQDWSHAAAEALAEREGTLTADHWEILELLRQFYQEYQLSPATRPLINTALKLGPDKGNSRTACSWHPAKLAAAGGPACRPIAYDPATLESSPPADPGNSGRTPVR